MTRGASIGFRGALIFENRQAMEYIEVKIKFSPFSEDNADWIVAEIESLGFDSFSVESPCLMAYIPKDKFDETLLNEALKAFEGILEIEVSHDLVPEKNWNAIWESQFQPIVVDDRCTVKATFHKDLPDTEFNIVIDPKMAFGTGHHQTTYLMISSLMDEAVAGKSVLDMGCGTSILAILAAMRGAKSPVTAIDIDHIAAESALENSALNGVGDCLDVKCGDASLLGDKMYDLVLANINRNILMSDIPVYSSCMSTGAVLLISGFYTEDVPMLVAVASRNGLQYDTERSRDNWAVVRFVKK